MQFDLFHSIGRIDSIQPRLNDEQVIRYFLEQSAHAEELGFNTVWVAESHFSSEVQKSHAEPVIPHYQGEVGINCDSAQLFHMLRSRTKSINFGTAIFNIVGGNGGPIAAADRIQSLAFFNSLESHPRQLNIGIASGRFPYINAPFGIVPRDDDERENWELYKRCIFLEALEIFLRLCQGETLGSRDVSDRVLPQTDLLYRKRWEFEPIKLVPELSADARARLKFVLGSHDPLARDVAFKLADVDVFNLSFTPPEQLNAIHAELRERCAAMPDRKQWQRQRMPRTVLVFIDRDRDQAHQIASSAFDTYIEAMRGTVRFPPKEVLMARALIGTPDDILYQIDPNQSHGFHSEDRLMLWFEFNQTDNAAIFRQMELFAESVMHKV